MTYNVCQSSDNTLVSLVVVLVLVLVMAMVWAGVLQLHMFKSESTEYVAGVIHGLPIPGCQTLKIHYCLSKFQASLASQRI